MKDLFEKLGITPGPWEVSQQKESSLSFLKEIHIVDSNGYYQCGIHKANSTLSKKDAHLIAAAPEMLEALIDAFELIGCIEVNEDKDFNIDQWLLPVIEKATGKSWEEIKNELI